MDRRGLVPGKNLVLRPEGEKRTGQARCVPIFPADREKLSPACFRCS
ncbi:hypothetical protein DESPIG_00211 [Desulfovibrio piger ATCC 29098]|uniref:Uncharacterized protein n=1 Tax=Desulfovibrio piger ATCC 29098 TaxID=411464 RepID=B6WQ87_9BACT|nr:hypothetical protein DESPIG_00211 [Desulfovibrio piger ATCC 29098]